MCPNEDGVTESQPSKRQRCQATPPPSRPFVLDALYENKSTLQPAVLHQRYKRFLGDVMLGAGTNPGTDDPSTSVDHKHNEDMITVHVPNTGPMTGLLDDLPARVCLSKSSNKQRKYAYTLEWMEVGGTWVGVHSAKANAMVGQLLDAGMLDAHLPAYTTYKREVKLGSSGASSRSKTSTRIDFELTDEETGFKCLIEVKSVTMKDGNLAVFPDTKSERAQKHVRELVEWKARHNKHIECMMVYVVQRDDCEMFLPCKEKDPVYYELVRKGVQEQGLRVLVLQVGLERVDNSAEEFRVVYKGVMELGKWL
jgi:sugar fermentation stimulation protein A